MKYGLIVTVLLLIAALIFCGYLSKINKSNNERLTAQEQTITDLQQKLTELAETKKQLEAETKKSEEYAESLLLITTEKEDIQKKVSELEEENQKLVEQLSKKAAPKTRKK